MGLIQDALAVSPIALAGDYQKIQLVIEELTGSEKRKIVLQGTAMPLDKIPGGMEQSVSSRDYFGSTRRALHVKGHHPVPTSFSGRWMYPLLTAEFGQAADFHYFDATNGDILVENPTQARELMNEVLRGGQTLHVYWTAPDQVASALGTQLPKSVSCQGVMKAFRWEEEKWSAINWTLEFEWEKETVSSNALPILPATVNPGNVLSMLNNLTKQLKGLATGVLSDINGLIDGALGYMTFATNTVNDITDVAEGFANLPASAAQKVVTGLISGRDAIDNIAFATNRTVASYTGVADSWNGLTTGPLAWDYLFNDKDDATASEQISSAASAFDVQGLINNIDYEFTRQLRKARQSAKAAVKDVYIEAKQGDSYRKWASVYFKDTGKWLEIAMANGDFRDIIEVGRMYRIPLSEVKK